MAAFQGGDQRRQTGQSVENSIIARAVILAFVLLGGLFIAFDGRVVERALRSGNTLIYSLIPSLR